MKKLVEKFCTPFGLRVHKGKEFMAYPHDVYFPKHKSKYVSEGFMDYINQTYPDITDVSEFTWSLLHEIGHTQTWNEFSKKDWKRYAKKAPHVHDIEEYYAIPQEHRANDWAAEYIRNHPKKIRKFEKKIKGRI